MRKTKDQVDREYDQAMLRSRVVSVLWAVIDDKKKNGGYKLQQLADILGINKGLVSRWFSSEPNWRLNTVADIAGALNVDIQITARERMTGRQFGAGGLIATNAVHTETSGPVPASNRAETRVEAA